MWPIHRPTATTVRQRQKDRPHEERNADQRAPSPRECRIAIVEDGILEEPLRRADQPRELHGQHLQGEDRQPRAGDPSAAFVDFSVGRNGFLHVSDVEPQYYRQGQGGRRGGGWPRARRAPPRPSPRAVPAPTGAARGRGHSAAGRPRPRTAREPPPPPPSYPEDRPPPRPEPRAPPWTAPRRAGVATGTERRRFGEGLVGEDEGSAPAVPSPPPLPTPSRPEARAGRPSPDEPAPRRRSEPAFGSRGRPRRRDTSGRTPGAPATGVAAGDGAPARGKLPRTGSDAEADLPPSRTGRQRTQPSDSARPGSSRPDDARARAIPPPTRPPARDDEDDLFAARDVELRPGRCPTSSPRSIPPRPGTAIASRRRRPWRAGPVAARPAPESRITPEAEAEPLGSRPDLAFGEELLREAGPEDRAEPPRRRGGRDAIRNRGNDREPTPRDRDRRDRDLSTDRGGPWRSSPEFERPRARSSLERPRAIEPERPRAIEPERPRAIEPERPRPIEPERPRGVEPERGPAHDRPERRPARDRDASRPIDRAGEEGYVPRRMRSQPGEAPFGGEAAAGGWPGVEDDLTEDIEAPGEPGAEGDDDRSGTRRRRRRRRRRGERPARESSAARGAAGDVEFEAEREPVALLDDEEVADPDDFDFGDEPARARLDSDDEILDDDDDELTPRVPSPDDEIDPELEEEIRKEIEEIAELRQAARMGLRGTTEARPRRGVDPPRRPRGAEGGGRRGPGRPSRPRPGDGQAPDPGGLPPRRRGAHPGHQGEHRHHGHDSLDLHQHPRPLSSS